MSFACAASGFTTAHSPVGLSAGVVAGATAGSIEFDAQSNPFGVVAAGGEVLWGMTDHFSESLLAVGRYYLPGSPNFGAEASLKYAFGRSSAVSISAGYPDLLLSAPELTLAYLRDASRNFTWSAGLGTEGIVAGCDLHFGPRGWTRYHLTLGLSVLPVGYRWRQLYFSPNGLLDLGFGLELIHPKQARP